MMLKVPTDLMRKWCYSEDGKYKLKKEAPEQARKDFQQFQSESGIKPWKEVVEESRKAFDKRTKR